MDELLSTELIKKFIWNKIKNGKKRQVLENVSFWKRFSQILQVWIFSCGKTAFCRIFWLVFFCHYVTIISCCYKWLGQVEPFRKMQRLRHSWRATKLDQEEKMSENSGYCRWRNYNSKQEIFSLRTDQQGISVHTQSAVNIREQPAKLQSNGMKFLRTECGCLDLHQLKTFFSWLRPSDKARTQLWRHLG